MTSKKKGHFPFDKLVNLFDPSFEKITLNKSPIKTEVR